MADSAPKSSGHPDRAHVVQDDTAHPTQLLLMTDAEAADWLTATAAGKSWPRVGHTTGPGGPTSPGARRYGVTLSNGRAAPPLRRGQLRHFECVRSDELVAAPPIGSWPPSQRVRHWGVLHRGGGPVRVFVPWGINADEPVVYPKFEGTLM
ncbi:hypothetical protein [Streptomyces sp. NPDC029674]|uniref:hypothetical protein n=1 Tax=Streptomyces sp. NPDC029674 TaxID=3365297 RepID=UPI00384A5EF6